MRHATWMRVAQVAAFIVACGCAVLITILLAGCTASSAADFSGAYLAQDLHVPVTQVRCSSKDQADGAAICVVGDRAYDCVTAAPGCTPRTTMCRPARAPALERSP